MPSHVTIWIRLLIVLLLVVDLAESTMDMFELFLIL